MTRLIDLDAVARPDIRVALNQEEYALPGDIPVPRMLRLMELGERWDDAIEKDDTEGLTQILGEMYEEVLDLFRQRQSDLEALDISGPQVEKLFGEVFALYEEPEAPPPTPPKRTPSRRSSPRSASSGKPKQTARS